MIMIYNNDSSQKMSLSMILGSVYILLPFGECLSLM